MIRLTFRQSWELLWRVLRKEWLWQTELDSSRKMSWRWSELTFPEVASLFELPLLQVLELTGLACPTILGKGKAIIDGGFPTHQPLQHMQKVCRCLAIWYSSVKQCNLFLFRTWNWVWTWATSWSSHSPSPPLPTRWRESKSNIVYRP